jgi:hypothetical protein
MLRYLKEEPQTPAQSPGNPHNCGSLKEGDLLQTRHNRLATQTIADHSKREIYYRPDTIAWQPTQSQITQRGRSITDPTQSPGSLHNHSHSEGRSITDPAQSPGSLHNRSHSHSERKIYYRSGTIAWQQSQRATERRTHLTQFYAQMDKA